MTPRGIRDNNPGNLRPLPNGQTWNGQTGVDADPSMGNYCQFVDPPHGFRALVENLHSYQTHDGCDTLLKVFTRWAPSEDHNNPDSYASFIASRIGVGLEDTYMFDNNGFFIAAKAICQEENGLNNGQPWFSDDVIQAGVALAFPPEA